MVNTPAENRRECILEAARTIFIRDGYSGTKLTTIAKEAGCSVGTLYTYFKDRDELLKAVLAAAEAEMKETPVLAVENRNPIDKIVAGNRAYLESFRKNAKVMALLEEASMHYPEFRSERSRRAWDFVHRNARAIERMLASGECTLPPGTDPEILSAALSAMVSRVAYAVWVDGDIPDTDESFERVCAALNGTWLRALGLDDSRIAPTQN